MIKFAVVELIPRIGQLHTFVWKEGFECIKEAEKERIKYLDGCELDPQNVQVLQYST